MIWLRQGLNALLALGTLAVAAVAAVLWLLGSEAGTGWLAARVLPRAEPLVSVGRVRGSLLGGLLLEDVRVRLPRDELDIDSLALTWNTAPALIGTLAFSRAEASRATYRRLPGTNVAGGGPIPELPFTIRVEQASVATLSLTVGETTLVFEDTRTGAALAGRRLELTELASVAGEAELYADATIVLDDPIALTVAGNWSAPVLGVEAAGSVNLDGDWPALQIRHELTAPFLAVAEGGLDFAAATRVDLAIEWQDLAWPGVDVIASPDGRLAIAGELGAYRYDGTGTVDIAGRAAGFAVRGTGARLELALERLALDARTVEGEAGQLTGQGVLSLAERNTLLDVAASDFDPAWILAEWPGRLSGTATLEAGLEPALAASLGAAELAGEVRGYPVALQGAAAYVTPNSWRFDALRLESTSNRVVLEGGVDSTRVELAVDAQLADLDLLWPDLGGALDADVAIDGTWQEPRARGRVVARGLELDGAAVERFEANGQVGLAPATPLDLTVEAEGLRRGSVAVEGLRGTLIGTTAAHSATAEVEAAEWRASAAASGGLTGGVWRGTLAELEVDEQLLGAWRLDEPAAMTLGSGRAALATSCLLHASRARLCVEADVEGRAEDRLVASAQNFDLETLRPLLPPEVTLAGVYQASASLFDVTGDPRGAVAVTGSSTRARIELGEGQDFAAELEELRAGATLLAGRLELQASVRSTTAGRAELSALIDDVRARDSPIDGALRVEWPDLAFLALLSPELGQVGGTLAVDLDVDGTVNEPAVDGQAQWTGGRVTVPEWAFVVEGIEATAASRGGRVLELNATGRAGEGLLTLTGNTRLDPEAGWPTRLELHGDSVRAVQLPEAEIFASPDLDIDVALPDIRVTGTVHVPRASLELSELPAQAVVPSPDAVLHGQTVARETRPLRLSTAIELTLGGDVRYAGLGLQTTVSGGLRLQTAPNASATATGNLNLAGNYTAYGQTLELERGQLLFGGPLDNPGLDVRAVREIDTTRVGVELTGTVQTPRTRVFSDPVMSEADALSYLLFGRPLSGTEGTEETSALQAAAISMGLQQALPAVQRIGDTLGLDELSVGSTATDSGALMAGKYLSPKLYVRYSYGLFNRIGGFLVRYKVNDRFSIETRSGDQQSMDLLYMVEKD